MENNFCYWNTPVIIKPKSVVTIAYMRLPCVELKTYTGTPLLATMKDRDCAYYFYRHVHCFDWR